MCLATGNKPRKSRKIAQDSKQDGSISFSLRAAMANSASDIINLLPGACVGAWPHVLGPATHLGPPTNAGAPMHVHD